jgi:hypothetical protein
VAVNRLASLTSPDKGRWQPMLLCLAVAGACIAAVTYLKPGEAVASLLAILAFAAWGVGALAMVGYVRWFFGKEFAQAKRESKADD